MNVAPEGRPTAHRLVMASPSVAAALTVNDKVYPSMTPDKASELLVKLREEA